ncbi:hypothetical protein SLH46_04415 [Draconibacterium sp. IB214405]|uniref:hypothetical protein n=1 Tax=Draconibacterium sp. IB214405 TaxID=3097352 RepID=UPI002A13D434|nr:hypothetical protein [Draconibacterium sp. IB214405]MDX8338416.1 hypothetical protein [Draconibacterium sp. IB214405]
METLTVCPTSTATILACQQIAKTFKENIYELSVLRREWDPEFATSLSVWIDDTIDKHYADDLDVLQDEHYREWHDIMVEGLQHLKVLRASMKVDFKRDKAFLKDFFLNTGYSDYFSDAKNGDHISLFKFLKTFAANINEGVRQKVVEKGTPDILFDKILVCANRVSQFEDCFIALEGEASLDNYGKNEVAQIYEAIQDICRIAIAYYQFDPEMRCKFNYYKVMVNL